MGLISTPATESILLVLPPARAGVGSAVNDATRELGGTLGVAVVGSVFSSVFGSHLASGAFAALPRSVLGAGAGLRRRRPGAVTGTTRGWSRRSTTRSWPAMSTSCIVVGLLCLAGAVAAAFLLPGRLPAPVEVTEPEPDRRRLTSSRRRVVVPERALARARARPVLAAGRRLAG